MLGLAACGGGDGDGGSAPAPAPEPDTAEMEKSVALAVALEAAAATDADGAVDDAPYGVAPTVTASREGTTVTIGVTESGTPRGGSARTGDFAEQEDGPAAIAGWTGAPFRRGAATERLVVYTDVAAPEGTAFSPENLNRLREVNGLTGETVPASGLSRRAVSRSSGPALSRLRPGAARLPTRRWAPARTRVSNSPARSGAVRGSTALRATSAR